MAIDKTLINIDPSRYTVYQMLDYLKETRGIALRQERLDKLYLFKTEPYVDSLYNYAHILTENISPENLQAIKDFFGAADFRIKVPTGGNPREFLLAQGFKFKDSGYTMIADNFSAPPGGRPRPNNVVIKKVADQQMIRDYKSVFAAAFGRSLEETERKLGFLDKTILDPADQHIKAFILYEDSYEDSTPAAIGSYYAFDQFSVEGIGTRPEFRGRGYAQLIMARLAQAAGGLGYESACLEASEAGAPVYKKFGLRALAATDTFISQ